MLEFLYIEEREQFIEEFTKDVMELLQEMGCEPVNVRSPSLGDMSFELHFRNAELMFILNFNDNIFGKHGSVRLIEINTPGDLFWPFPECGLTGLSSAWPNDRTIINVLTIDFFKDKLKTICKTCC